MKRKLEFLILGLCALLAIGLATTRSYLPHDWFKLDYLISLSSLLTVASAGIIEAQLSYVPSFREVRSRPLPDRLREPYQSTKQTGWTPVLLGAPCGGGLGLRWRM